MFFEGRAYRRTHARTDGRTDERTDGRTDARQTQRHDNSSLAFAQYGANESRKTSIGAPSVIENSVKHDKINQSTYLNPRREAFPKTSE